MNTSPLLRGEGIQVLAEAARLLRSKSSAKWSRLHVLGPDVALGLERLDPHHPLQRELNRLRADVGIARLVVRTRSRMDHDVSLLMRVEEALKRHPLRDSRARLGQFALLRELDRWAHEHRVRLDDWFLERLAQLPSVNERAVVFDWLNGSATSPRPIHRLSRALRMRDAAEVATALEQCPLDDASRELRARAQSFLELRRKGVALPLERTLLARHD